MTCIVGIKHAGCVYIGGDSAGIDVSDCDITSRLDSKVFINGPSIIGFANSYRMGQLLRYAFDPPVQSSEQDDMTYLVVDFISSFREMLIKHGHVKKDDEDPGDDFILGYREQLYVIGVDFQVSIPAVGYAAIGIGAPYALGSLHTTRSSKLNPTKRIEKALGAAAYHNAAVSKPFKILNVSKTALKT